MHYSKPRKSAVFVRCEYIVLEDFRTVIVIFLRKTHAPHEKLRNNHADQHLFNSKDCTQFHFLFCNNTAIRLRQKAANSEEGILSLRRRINVKETYE